MKIPKKLKIQGHIFKVDLVDTEVLDNDAGAMNLSRGIIQLRKDLPTTQLEEALIHEILHALNNEMKEVEVEWLAQGIYQVLSDNKLLK